MRRTIALGVLGAAILGVGMDVEAAVVICSNRKNKLTLRVDACKGRETPVDAAELGVTGPQGVQGAPGLSGVEVQTAQSSFITTGTVTGSATASCPAGKKVIGGGGQFVFVAANPTDVRVNSSVPVTTDPQGWTHDITVTVTDDWAVRAYAICANAAD